MDDLEKFFIGLDFSSRIILFCISIMWFFILLFVVSKVLGQEGYKITFAFALITTITIFTRFVVWLNKQKAETLEDD